MDTTRTHQPSRRSPSIPWFGARKMARKLAAEVQEIGEQRDTARDQLARLTAMGRELVAEVKELRAQREAALKQLEVLGALSVAQLEARRIELSREIAEQATRLDREKVEATAALQTMKRQLDQARQLIVATDDTALLQEVGIYHYRHPLTDVVAYEKELAEIENQIKGMARKDGGASSRRLIGPSTGRRQRGGQWSAISRN